MLLQPLRFCCVFYLCRLRYLKRVGQSCLSKLQLLLPRFHRTEQSHVGQAPTLVCWVRLYFLFCVLATVFTLTCVLPSMPSRALV
jgi:hypothetical protein